MHKISMCCLQEIDNKSDFNKDLSNFKGHTLLAQMNAINSGSGIYIKNEASYLRKKELED